MSRTVFLDASGWFAALSPPDRWHSAARRAYEDATRAGISFLSTTLVVAEVHALLLRWRGVRAGRRFLEVAFDTPSLTLVAADLELIRASIDGWIAGYPDQTFSLCDALSFEIMRRERVTYALAFDRHFEVAGYQLLT